MGKVLEKVLSGETLVKGIRVSFGEMAVLNELLNNAAFRVINLFLVWLERSGVFCSYRGSIGLKIIYNMCLCLC